MDKELKAMASVQRVLFKLESPARERVLNWIVAKAKEGAWRDDAPKARHGGNGAVAGGVQAPPPPEPQAVAN